MIVHYEIKTEDVYEDFSNDKEMFDFSNYSTYSKYYNNSNTLVVCKMIDEIAGVAIEKFARLKAKIYSPLVDYNSGQKKAKKNVNRSIFATIRHNEYKDVLLNMQRLSYSSIRIESKDHKIGFYEINEIFLSCFDDEI